MLLLASASPRRRELLLAAGVEFSLFSPQIDEAVKRGEAPKALVRRLAEEKARAASEEARRLGLRHVLAADTVVALGRVILNKPKDAADATRMMRLLSAKTHHVFTGCSLLDAKSAKQRTIVVATQVRFRKLSREDVARYVAGGEGADKAGAYAIQGEGAALIADVHGSYTNVIGLPVAEVLALIGGAK